MVTGMKNNGDNAVRCPMGTFSAEDFGVTMGRSEDGDARAILTARPMLGPITGSPTNGCPAVGNDVVVSWGC